MNSTRLPWMSLQPRLRRQHKFGRHLQKFNLAKVQFGKSSIFQVGSWIQEKSFAPGAGEFPGAGDEAAGGAAEISFLLVVIVYVLNSIYHDKCLNLWQQVWWAGVGWAELSLTHQLRCLHRPCSVPCLLSSVISIIFFDVFISASSSTWNALAAQAQVLQLRPFQLPNCFLSKWSCYFLSASSVFGMFLWVSWIMFPPTLTDSFRSSLWYNCSHLRPSGNQICQL